MDEHPPPDSLRSVAAICCAASVSLGVMYYVGRFSVYAQWFPQSRWHPDPNWVLKGYVWWAGWAFFAYVILPAAVAACLPGEQLRTYHLSVRGLRPHVWWYVALLGAVLPAVCLASTTPAFRTYYPMYKPAGRSWSDLLVWEGLYASQFVGIEFFFRGFLLRGLSRHIGPAAIFISVMPYSMVHYGKPWPEVAGAIAAGSVLGWLALKTSSIWGGVCLHITVAWSMDLLALAQKGQLPWVH